jgi:thiol-disulfide isomerase/thioredoxin
MVYFHTNFASALWESVTRSGKMIAPVYADLSQQYDNVLFLKVDIDKLTVTAHKNKIRGVPTFQFYQKGAQMTHSFSGGDRAQLERNVQMSGERCCHCWRETRFF